MTLSPENLLWLRAQSKARGSRSLSETLDHLLHQARSGKPMPVAHRTAVGMVRISAQDPELKDADAAIRDLFSLSLDRLAKTPRDTNKKQESK